MLLYVLRLVLPFLPLDTLDFSVLVRAVQLAQSMASKLTLENLNTNLQALGLQPLSAVKTAPVVSGGCELLSHPLAACGLCGSATSTAGTCSCAGNVVGWQGACCVCACVCPSS